MKHIITIVAATLLLLIPSAAKADTLQADKAYNEGHYDEAVTLYRQALDSLGPDSRLYYNLGNAFYRTGDRARAIANYERALRADASNSEARACLGFVNSQLPERPGERGTVISQILDSISTIMSPNAWSVTAFILFLLTLVAVGAYILSSSIPVRKTGFFGGIALLILTVLTIIVALRAASNITADNRAVVVADKVVVSTEPREAASTAEEAGVVYNGSTVEITDSVVSASAAADSHADWMEVRVDNSTHGWVPANALERI